MAIAATVDTTVRGTVFMVQPSEARELSEMGHYIVEEYTRRHHRWNASALADAARVHRGTLDLILKGKRADGTPVQQWPETLRAIAYGIAAGDSNPDAGERVYARLADIAGILPRLSSWVPPSAEEVERMTEEEYKRISRQAKEDLLREMMERLQGEGA